MSRNAHTSTPINPVLAARWSPRSFDTTATLTPADLTPAFEAARWSPSANNNQTSRFIVGFHGDETFNKIVPTLAGWNAAWMPNAPVIVVTVAKVLDAKGNRSPYAIYDLGQAVAHFTFQAQSDGLYVHQVAGTDAQALAEAFNIPEGFEVFHTFAVGKLGDADALPAELAERENAPRERLPLEEIVRYDAFED
ncbi:nitroreductase family protein [Aurantimicrobium minutum]|uniref:nitroreductase family protein n=1 Tax=Aurantimicrobium minutum TaxID=708131 RepID=UPI0024757B7E|nr:nitroreductase family protein [Aurantimicrobium minutum]MDH6207446.1 nitroreductase [Aurantimicrobium minutum]